MKIRYQYPKLKDSKIYPDAQQPKGILKTDQ